MYKARVFAQKQRNPCLSYLYEYLCQPHPAKDRSRIVALDFFNSQSAPLARDIPVFGLINELQSNSDAQSIASSSPGEIRKGRLLLIEDISNLTMEELGNHYNIDPFFFASYMQQAWRKTGTQSPSLCSLPSQEKKQNFLPLAYHRTLSFRRQNEPLSSMLRNCNHQRKVVLLPSMQGQTIGLAQHCCSILLIAKLKEEWIGIVLVDPAITDDYLPSRHQGAIPADQHSVPYLGGCEDFITHSPSNEPNLTIFPPFQGILDELVHQWGQSAPTNFNVDAPTLASISYYPLKIVASEWVNYASVMSFSIREYELSSQKSGDLIAELEKLNVNLRLLQGWRRRVISTQAKIKRAIRFITFFSDNSKPNDEFKGLLEDYEFLKSEIGEYAKRLEAMVPLVTSAVALIESRRSLVETANVTRLTILAMVFVPLSFVAGLFSMSDGYRPGGSLFWVYFAVAVPIVVVVGLVAKPPKTAIQTLRRRFNAFFKA